MEATHYVAVSAAIRFRNVGIRRGWSFRSGQLNRPSASHAHASHVHGHTFGCHHPELHVVGEHTHVLPGAGLHYLDGHRQLVTGQYQLALIDRLVLKEIPIGSLQPVIGGRNQSMNSAAMPAMPSATVIPNMRARSPNNPSACCMSLPRGMTRRAAFARDDPGVQTVPVAHQGALSRHTYLVGIEPMTGSANRGSITATEYAAQMATATAVVVEVSEGDGGVVDPGSCSTRQRSRSRPRVTTLELEPRRRTPRPNASHKNDKPDQPWRYGLHP